MADETITDTPRKVGRPQDKTVTAETPVYRRDELAEFIKDASSKGMHGVPDFVEIDEGAEAAGRTPEWLPPNHPRSGQPILYTAVPIKIGDEEVIRTDPRMAINNGYLIPVSRDLFGTVIPDIRYNQFGNVPCQGNKIWCWYSIEVQKRRREDKDKAWKSMIKQIDSVRATEGGKEVFKFNTTTNKGEFNVME